ncbi:hypothetical protein J6Q66_08550 [bacterium]|nr:hypothetical protein [bacterium]
MRENYEKGSNMNLNEECLLNYLINPNNINNLSVLLGDFYVNQQENQVIENSFVQSAQV